MAIGELLQEKAAEIPILLAGIQTLSKNIKICLELMTSIDPKDPMSVAMNLIKNQQMQTALSNDPRVVGMQAQAYVDPMNQLADKASERAMKGHIFAMQQKLPQLYAEARARKFDFINPVIQEMRANRTKRFQDTGGSILKFNV
jgi:hypothetical protein